MNALSSNPLVPDVREAMARGLLGAAGFAPSPITCHARLPALETGASVSLADCTWPEGTHVAAHRHAHEDEVVVVVSGLLDLRMGGQVLRLGPGRTAVVPRGTEHEVRALSTARHIAILTRHGLESPTA